jgi:HNH endonuclease
MSTFKRKYTYKELKNCINPSCNNQIQLRIIGDKDSKEYGLPVSSDRRKLACSRECHNLWQKSITWEQRVGEEFAAQFRQKMSNLASTNNSSTLPGIAEKISKSMKQYLSKNPQARLGKNNGFFGHKHSAETIQHWKEIKRGKWAYNQEQKEKQTKNTPKKENHPNWLGGISNGEYGLEFNRKYKEYIKTHYNSTCQICNTSTDELDIHHIDYNKTNNLLENLIPLCKSCHGKTNYDREKWQKRLTK